MVTATDVGIQLGGLQVVVAQEVPHPLHWHTAQQQVGGNGVAQDVRCDPATESRPFDQPL